MTTHETSDTASAAEDRGRRKPKRAGRQGGVGNRERVPLERGHAQQHQIQLCITAGDLGGQEASIGSPHPRLVFPFNRVAGRDDPLGSDNDAAGGTAPAVNLHDGGSCVASHLLAGGGQIDQGGVG